MKKVSIYTTLILFFLSWNSFAAYKDSLLVSTIKDFIKNQSQFQFCQPFYTTWSRTDKPYINLYISESDRVESATRHSHGSFGTNEKAAKERAARYETRGHHAFVYKTYATSSAELNDRFISYSEESKCFIVLHEFFHHFRHDLDLDIPYEFEEALGDVIGNYGAIEFVRQYKATHLKSIKKQKWRNERIYKIINHTTDVINRKPGKVNALNLKCQKRIEQILVHGDQFQKDRFGFEVNNGYLLKNRFYSEKYFVLKKLFRKAGNLNDFLSIIKRGPSESKEFGAYLDSFL